MNIKHDSLHLRTRLTSNCYSAIVAIIAMHMHYSFLEMLCEFFSEMDTLKNWLNKNRLYTRDRLQRCLLLLMVPILMLASSGISLVPVTTNSDSISRSQISKDQSFPCESHACGCITAEICRSSCCCFQFSHCKSNRSPAVESKHLSEKINFRFVIKSASCSGRDIVSLTIKTMFWIAETPSSSVVTYSNICHRIEVTSTYNSLGISPDPPIPRRYT